MEKRIIIIDGNSLINRAYYAMQKPMITKEGIFTQGIYGFLNMLEKIKKDYPSGYIVVTFDMKAPTFRHKAYKEYKAGRKKMPNELAMELPWLKEILTAMNIKMVEKEGFEADDIIGTIAKRGEEEGLSPLIITGDKDALQLASKKTKVLITKKGISQFKIYDYDHMVETYGFTPTQFIDYKGLMGDSSDNIPGIEGVGAKTAQKLILEYGSVEELIKHTGDLKGKLKERVEENSQIALMSKTLATINVNMPLEIKWEEYLWEEPDIEKLVALYQTLEFNRFLGKLDLGKVKGEEASSFSIPEHKVQVIQSEKDLENLKVIEKEGQVVLKAFDNALGQLEGCALLYKDTYIYVHLTDKKVEEGFLTFLRESSLKIIGHDVKKEILLFMEKGIMNWHIYFDTAISEYVIDPGKNQYELGSLAEKYLHFTLEEEDLEQEQLDFFGKDQRTYVKEGEQWCFLVDELFNIERKRLKEEGLEAVYEQVELPLIEVMAYMQHVGFTVDKKVLKALGEDLGKRITNLTKEIYTLAGEEFNINSPAQLGPILFDKLKLTPGKKTKRGYSTGAEVLERITDEHEIIPLILEYRRVSKLMSTYIHGLIPLVREDGKIHAHFNQMIAATGRISSSEPNLQNIPIRQEEGRKIRKAFIPSSKEYSLLGADYSQIELRILAHLSDDEKLIEGFNKGEDIHRATAAHVLSIPEEEITVAERSRAKAINFGVIYGMSAFGLSSELKISRNEADEYIKEYFHKHQAVKDYMDGQVSFGKEHGYVTTILGRKRPISEINASNYMVRQMGERLAMNSPIQGSAADIIKIAMINVYKALKNHKSRLILQVHDELIIEVAKEEREEVKTLLIEGMEQAISLKVKLSVGVEEGDNWYQLK